MMSTNKIYIYFDTNVLIDFYELSSSDISKIESYKKIKMIIPIITDLTIDEYNRNREKISHFIENKDSINNYTANIKNLEVPIVKELDSYKEFQDAHKNYCKHLKEIKKELKQKYNKRVFPADILVQRFTDNAIKYNIDREVFEESKMRYDLGYAPGKGTKYNDMVIWQTIIKNIKTNADVNKLYFCVNDNDYVNHKEELSKEFKEKTSKQIEILKLDELLKKIIPELDRTLKERLSKLNKSGSLDVYTAYENFAKKQAEVLSKCSLYLPEEQLLKQQSLIERSIPNLSDISNLTGYPKI